MIGGIHDDGRIVLMASEHGIAPVIKYPDGTWGPAAISGQELDEFTQLSDEAIAKILEEALRQAVVHYVGYASQPYVQIMCTGVLSYVHVKPENLPEGVYRSDDGLYTFDDGKASCVKCVEAMAKAEAESEKKEVPRYKPCQSCKEWREDGNWELAIRCNNCKGKGAVRSHESYQCNCCGGSMAPTEDSEDKSPHGLVEATVGGGFNSFHLTDCTTYEFSVCEKCLRYLFDCVFEVPPQAEDRLGSGGEGYEEDSKRYQFRLWQAEGGRKEAYFNGICTNDPHCGRPARWVCLSERFDLFKPEATHSTACDGHVWEYVHHNFSKIVPIEKVPLNVATPEQLEVLKEALAKAPSQNFFQNKLSEEDLVQKCRDALGDQWDEWSTAAHLKDGESAADLLDRDGLYNAYFIHVLIQVFAQRGEIPYQNS